MDDNNNNNNEVNNPPGDDAIIPGVNEIPGVHEIPGVNEIPDVEETPDPTRVSDNINLDAAFPTFPLPSDTEDVTIIKPKIEQVSLEYVLEDDKITGIGTYSNSNAENDNNDNVGNNTTIDDNDEVNDNKIFHPSDPLPSEKQAWTSPHMQLHKQRRFSYSHLHKYKDEFTNLMHHMLAQYML